MVRFKFRPDRKNMEQRKCISEHPFGTIKRAMGAAYFLLKGMRKVSGEKGSIEAVYFIQFSGSEPPQNLSTAAAVVQTEVGKDMKCGLLSAGTLVSNLIDKFKLIY